MKTFYFGIILLSFFVSTNVLANWKHSPSVTIKELIQWEGTGKIFFTLSNNTRCFIEDIEHKNYSLLLALYSSQQKATFHCYPEEFNIGGIVGHKFHRVITHVN